MKRYFIGLLAISLMTLTACDRNDADIVSENLSKAADQFELVRRIIFYNAITDTIMLEIVGRCSLGNYDSSKRMSVTCKVGEDQYLKHMLGLSDNVSFMSEQIGAAKASAYHYRRIFKPQSLIPDIELKTSLKELTE